MCSKLHNDSKPIPESGYGWKIFDVGNSPCFRCLCPYIRDKDGFIRWVERQDEGFAFFLTRKEARRCLRNLKNDEFIGDHYKNRYIRKIHYRRGMGCHLEERIDGRNKYKIALCKEFKITEVRG